MRALIITCLLLAPGIGSAHHSPANFDLEVTDFEVTGRIASVSFRNPHSVMQLLVEARDGTTSDSYHCALAADELLAGIWLPDASRSQRMPADPLFTAEGRRIVDEWRATHDPMEDDPGAFCQALGGADYPVEIILTPDQVTLLLELHQQIRRIFMNRDEHPATMFPQRNGYSIGRWEGDTLVVDTRAIRAITFGSVPHSDRARVVERWHVIDDGHSLINDLDRIGT